MKNLATLLLGLFVVSALIAGCSNVIDSEPAVDSIEGEISQLEAAANRLSSYSPPPAPLVTVSVGEDNLNFWPYTGENYSGTPQDPINLIFYGEADPRDIRAALFSLDGDRTAAGFPAESPFNDTWQDAIGGIQVSYGDEDGWTGGSVQLTCGEYGPVRFHLRMFRLGQWTVANAHFEILIPGTTDHQVISWELAEQLVVCDFIRSGLLHPDIPMIPTDQINEAPFRTIPAIIYNELPVELRVAIGGPAGDVTEDVPIGTDGHALILNISGKVPRTFETRQNSLVIEYDQIVPKPFCSSGPYDYVYVKGPVYMEHIVTLDRHGDYHMMFKASGQLNVTPVNPMTGEPTGETLLAHVRENYASRLTDRNSFAMSMLFQKIIPASDPNAGRLFKFLLANSKGANVAWDDIKCPNTEFAEE